jgi:hypothetical protein
MALTLSDMVMRCLAAMAILVGVAVTAIFFANLLHVPSHSAQGWHRPAVEQVPHFTGFEHGFSLSARGENLAHLIECGFVGVHRRPIGT